MSISPIKTGFALAVGLSLSSPAALAQAAQLYALTPEEQGLVEQLATEYSRQSRDTICGLMKKDAAKERIHILPNFRIEGLVKQSGAEKPATPPVTPDYAERLLQGCN